MDLKILAEKRDAAVRKAVQAKKAWKDAEASALKAVAARNELFKAYNAANLDFVAAVEHFRAAVREEAGQKAAKDVPLDLKAWARELNVPLAE
jgi:hypothetical protein